MANVGPPTEPQWFEPVRFFNDIREFSVREFERMNQNQLDAFPAIYRTAVREVGRAVFTLQLIIRPKVRWLFIGSMVAISGNLEFAQLEIYYEKISEFMFQGYLHSDIFNTTLTSFAIIGELLSFLADFESHIPFYWQAIPWVNMYRHGLKDKLLAKGGWEELVRRATRSYTDSNLFDETRARYRNRLPIPHAETAFAPEDEFNPQLIRFFFGVAPTETELATAVLKKMYECKGDIFPEEMIQLD